MDAATKQRLTDGAGALGVTLPPSLVDGFGRYLDLLLTWNHKINLTAITDPIGVVDLHFLDSLALVRLIGAARTLVDVGSGAGFPGAVLAMACPTLEVVAVEPTRKKIAFLQTLAQQLAPNLHPVCARHDRLIDAQQTFDLAVSRATWDPAEWVLQGGPLVAPGGRLLALETPSTRAEGSTPGWTAGEPVRYTIAGIHRQVRIFQRS